MNIFFSILEKPFEQILEDEYSKFIIEKKFKTSVTNLIFITYCVCCLGLILSLILPIFSSSPYILPLGLILSIFFPFFVGMVFDFVITSEIQQFDLDCSFILRELIIISQTTKSEAQAYYFLTLSSNELLRYLAKMAFIDKNILNLNSMDSIISQIEKLKKSKVVLYIKSIFNNWSIKEIDINSYINNYQKIVQTKLDEDFQNLENTTTIFNAVVGIFPILVIFLIFIGFKDVHPFLELSLLLFLAILLLIWIVDPLRINPIIDFFGSIPNVEHSNNTKLLQDFFNLVIINHNLGKSLQELVFIEKKDNKLIQMSDIFNMNFVNLAELNLTLISILTKERGSKIENLFKLIFELNKIDYGTVLNQIPEFISNFSSIEQYYQKKFIFLKSEKKKSFLIIILNSFSLGILSVLLPYLFIINSFNFSLVYSVGFKTLLTPKLELLTSAEFLALSILIYLIYNKEYSMNSLKTALKYLSINTCLFLIGFFFCFILLQPVLSIV